MSMILDALSRAERERRNEDGVPLDPARYVGSSSIKEERLKKWILAALVVNIVLVVAVLSSYLWKEHLADRAPESTPPVSSDALTVPPSTTVATLQSNVYAASSKDAGLEQKDSLVIPPQNGEPRLSLREEAAVNETVKNATTEKKAIKNVVTKNPPVRYAARPLSKPGDHAPASVPLPSPELRAKNYTAITDLSAAERSRLNQYEINVHVYDSNMQNRFVLINMTKYKEGDRLSGGGPLIAAIIPEGVILDTGTGKALLERN